MKTVKTAILVVVVAVVAAGCREFSVFETPAPVKQPLLINAAAPTAAPQPLTKPDALDHCGR